MSYNDRRVVPRKPFAMPIRFVVVDGPFAAPANPKTSPDVAVNMMGPGKVQPLVLHQGETVNLSERGVAFKSPETLSLGQYLELFLTLPTELTGRIPEDVRCAARVVHVDSRTDSQGNVRIGAIIERFERITAAHDWRN
jgi:hypothetical protein